MFYNPLDIRIGILALRDGVFFVREAFAVVMLTWWVCYSVIKDLLWNVELCKQKCTCNYFCTCPSGLGFPMLFWSLCLHGLELLAQVGSVLLKSWMAPISGLFRTHMTSAYEASLFSFTCLCILNACFYLAEFAKTQAMSWRLFLQFTLST